MSAAEEFYWPMPFVSGLRQIPVTPFLWGTLTLGPKQGWLRLWMFHPSWFGCEIASMYLKTCILIVGAVWGIACETKA